ncbi:hypothetical protein LEGA110927_06880 [Leuconostoc gasicomitatum]|uniref:hypothetical protein n=1 Tax=Leuconostoc gasicomitatum TaxID=115778 RepID=UPI000BD2D5B6|nr:hypothetical protein [Leuconostoc gasicomitatum]MBZ5943563.1 hypothetical protein [Leuconostoc gasicomitatum]MBZ5948872.1 hypothetical protein [Leuconostoc gasicomitatum]MBZ5951797.1 hypothetical protein [Leuconostoc gasicomitatum]MBZ5968352.1 hypothetical protein [Leuconostoc gasicomitatum]MBZ5970905.1 hypothetical protein [Leuconostoc gasicomitatum]
MIKIITSELYKLKNSTLTWFILLISTAQIIVLPSYLLIKSSSIDISTICIVLSLLIPFETAVNSNLLVDQERKANNFENIISNNQSYLIITAKMITIDFVLIFPTIVVWIMAGIINGILVSCIELGMNIFLLSVLLNHAHMIINLVFSTSINYIVATIETLFIVFASNKVLVNAYWCPVAMPINRILNIGNHNTVTIIIYSMVMIILISIIVQRRLFKIE